MNRFAAAALAALALASPAVARTVSLPTGTPALAAVLPDAWKPTVTDRGMEATSPDGEVYASIEYAADDKADLAALMTADGTWMTKNGIVPDADSHDRDFLLNGLPAHEISYDGHDKDGPTKITYILVELPKDAVGVVTLWGTDGQRAGKEKAIEAILASIKPAGAKATAAPLKR